MEPKISPIFMRVFSSFLFVLSVQFTFACGWSVSPETSRLALFRAQREGFFKLTPFYYSADYYYATNTVSSVDQEKNCLEWKKKLGNSINPDDVRKILYETDSEQFQTAFENKSLKNVFPKNTFVDALLLSKNKAFLNYILLAKKLEYGNVEYTKWESWDQTEYNYDNHNQLEDTFDFEKKIKSTKDSFLKQRYAFLALRYYFYAQQKQDVIQLYNSYFASESNTILKPWALYYNALCIDDKVLQNYLLSKVFNSCEEKSFAVLQHYNWKLTEETLTLAQNDEERSVILAIEGLRNPAPGLKSIQEIYELSPNSLFLSFLIGREVNKLEDWIFTPQYTSDGAPSVVFGDTDWYNYGKVKEENFNKDILYLRELEYYLISIREQTSGEQKDYITAAIAQLCFIDDQVEEGKKYTDLISNKANASIQMQKNIQLALVSLKQDNLKDEKVQNQLYTYFDSVENLVETDHGLFKNLYSLYRIASSDFRKKGDIVTAGLLSMKSDIKNDGEYSGYSNSSFFNYIGYFDRNASVKDMDLLMALQQKTDKTPFEKYICSGTIAPNVNYYKDLKGTIAFRNNNLELAYETFSSMPQDFWEKNYEYKTYLNEDPFTPKILQKQEERKFDYRFNKTDFIAKLIQLKRQNTANSNLQLAHAYFNVSYLGNSWMMTAYDWTSGASYIDYVYGDNTENEKKYQNGNYYNLKMAKMYYGKALKMSRNSNEKAMASLMIFECNYYDHYAELITEEEEAKNPFKAGKELVNFYSIYKTTPTFKRYNCPLLKSFIN
ncbi:hypothetical protein [Flavobacterium nitrogenifigens]|uniref:Uncharacterized protein n=1 Tax=Flavobacterium nitrogenifigens TaxID=1617283 RepID=A0A521B7E1_9FLAO|nr:hypothetical protein [Flavobacterium nitrogenifigens]KAF2334527.1 hypothetical protein DM397_07595 [Flavobacterium nitrogenifigens]SMO42975.1 hypothetical protein SAMN06265220_101720 [Flavobacterium nitrogenifigens]